MKKTRIGFVRLCDAAPLVVARGLGSYVQQKVRVELVPLRSWAEVRDRLVIGDIQAAHCLASIPLVSQAGLYGPLVKLATAWTLNHYGNAITFSPALAKVARDGKLAELARERREAGKPLAFASVFPSSKHELELRHCLASHGVDPDADVRLVVMPPPETPDALRRGRIDGYCVGEPWNTRAILEGWGEAVATSASLALPGTEKVLAVREDFLGSEEHGAVLRALAQAADWLADAAHADAAVELLAPYLGRPLRELTPALTGQFGVRFGREVNRPDTAHARWHLERLQAGGLLAPGAPLAEFAARAFRNDWHDALVRQM